ncbi:MAG: hypothetical protein HY958_07630 [Bacteroidia bacterium]|nr:hypothetical protein [Bacteroidia bacterium]
MKKLFFVLLIVAGFISAFGQAKKPTLMIVPADIFCTRAGYTLEFDNQGTKKVLPDYKKTMQNDENMRLVITKIQGMFADRGFPLKNLEQELKKLEQESAEMSMMTSKTSGSAMAESPIDLLKRTAKADIILDIDFSKKVNGPQKYINFNLQGLDAYTSKAVANASGSGAPSSASQIEVLLEEAVLKHLDNFQAQLMTHFEDLFANGREVVVKIKVWDSSPSNLETEFNGEQLDKHIDDWFAKNTVKGRYSQADASENFMSMDQVRIPLYDDKGKALDTKNWLNGLKKELKGAPYSIETKLYLRGLGEAWLIIGEK